MSHVAHTGLLVLTVLIPTSAAEEVADRQYDLVIYGGTSAGVMAAVQAKRMGKTAIIVAPGKHLGGLSSGGLGWTDSGDKRVIGGQRRERFYELIVRIACRMSVRFCTSLTS